MEKSILNLGKVLSVAFALMGSFASCDDAEYDVISNQIYITQSMSGPTTKLVVDPDNGADGQFTVSLSDKALSNVDVKLTASESALNAYNISNGTNYKMLPASGYSFSHDKVTIEAGSTLSPSVDIHVNPFTEEQMNSGELYAIPIAVESLSGDFSAVSNLSSYIILLDKVIVTSVAILNGNNPTKPINPLKGYTLNEWSLEFRMNMSHYAINNQAIFGAYPDEVYVRFGDAGKPNNMLQIKTQGSQYESNYDFKDGEWYHIALVANSSTLSIYINGTLDGTMALSGSAKWTFNEMTLIGSGASYFPSDCMLSEFRFWTKTISQSQIQNYMFGINPETQGLEAYWKMNEGEGNIFHDATGHGLDLQAKGTVRWKDGIRSDGKE